MTKKPLRRTIKAPTQKTKERGVSIEKSTSHRLPVRMPNRMLSTLMSRIIEDKYGVRGKSKWVNEAIITFLKDSSWKDQVIDGDIIRGNDESCDITLSKESHDEVIRAVEEVTRHWKENNPATTDKGSEFIEREFYKASIVRAAINQRLFKLYMPNLFENEDLFRSAE